MQRGCPFFKCGTWWKGLLLTIWWGLNKSQCVCHHWEGWIYISLLLKWKNVVDTLFFCPSFLGDPFNGVWMGEPLCGLSKLSIWVEAIGGNRNGNRMVQYKLNTMVLADIYTISQFCWKWKLEWLKKRKMCIFVLNQDHQLIKPVQATWQNIITEKIELSVVLRSLAQWWRNFSGTKVAGSAWALQSQLYQCFWWLKNSF